LVNHAKTRAIKWQLHAGSKYHFGNQYTIPVSNSGVPKPVKMDGNHARAMLKDDAWKAGIKILDKSADTFEVWKVVFIIVI